MNSSDIVGLVAVIGVILIPSIGLTARFALKPIVESLIRLRESFDTQRTSVDGQRLQLLEQRVTDMQDSIDRLSDAVDFDKQLRAGTAATAALPGASQTDTRAS